MRREGLGSPVLRPLGGRFTPGCTGNGRPPDRSTSTGPVHLRACQEEIDQMGNFNCVIASPPASEEGQDLASFETSPFGSPQRVRGRVVGLFVGRRAERLTPACAGKGSARFPRVAPSSVQPRMRGDGPTPAFQTRPPSGSAPHARGRGLFKAGGVAAQRFSPACAGKVWLKAIGIKH